MKWMLALFPLMLIIGCAPARQDKEVIVRINDYSMSPEDIIDELSMFSSFEREGKTKEGLLEEIIQKKLLLLEAGREGLDKEGKFMKLVEHFWEQSLLRAIVDKKINEFLASTTVSEEELMGEVSKMAEDVEREDVKNAIIRDKVNRKFEEWIGSLRQKAKVYVDKDKLEAIPLRAEE